MPAVFVHGVNTRKSEPGYDARIRMTERFLRDHLAGVSLGGTSVQAWSVTFPYWGDLATTFAWNMASLPSGAVNALGGAVDDNLRPLIAVIEDGLADAKAAGQQPLLTLATKRGLPAAMDVVSDLLIESAPAAQAASVADFLIAAERYADANPRPAWLATIATDEQFLNKLATEAAPTPMTNVQALGGGGAVLGTLAAAGAKFKAAVKSAAGTVLDRSGDFASTKLLAWQRKSLNANLGRFFGDVFIYLDTRGDKSAPGAIPSLILGAIDKARADAPAGEPLVIVAHSLGGVITFDLLSSFRPELTVDLFVTVGSQVSHFEEIKRFKSSDPAVGPPNRAATPVNILRWINVFDEVDIFAYACEKVFDRVVDFSYDTRTYVVKSHGAYFEQDRFYARLRARIDQLP
jgi:hypothetical protein